jgi:type IV pilus assembly protein PilC
MNNNQNPNFMSQLQNNNQPYPQEVPKENKFISSSNPVKEKQKRFQYTVKDKTGKTVNGSFDAYTARDVNSFLISQGYEVISIKEDKLTTSLTIFSFSNRKMRNKDLIFFLTQLSTYIKSGIPLVDSVAILSRQTKDKHIKLLYQKLVFELNAGVSFSEALVKQGNSFPKLLINMVKTSELTGSLTDVLDDMANYYKTSETNRKEIIGALTYPSVIFVFAIAILTFIILWVVPQFTSMYSQLGSELPWITKLLISFSDFLSKYIFLIILAIALIIIILVVMYKNITSFRYFVQKTLMHIPVVSKIIKYNELIMFTKTFASLINHDVFITDSMEILGKITNNEIYKLLIRDAVNNLSTGNGVSVAFKDHWAFPQTAYEMLVTGERTGRLGPMMQNVANYYEEEQSTLIKQMKSLIEPIMIVFIAVMVGIILLSVIVPMFSMYDSI